MSDGMKERRHHFIFCCGSNPFDIFKGCTSMIHFSQQQQRAKQSSQRHKVPRILTEDNTGV